MNGMPPVILLGVDTPIGLTILRELGRHGVGVHGLGHNRRALGFYSRHLASRAIRAPGEAELVDQLRALGRETGARFIMAISEADIGLLNRHRPDLAPMTALVPDQRRMELVLDKAQTARIAAGLGIATPASHALAAPGDVASRARDMTFPVVLKWANPHAIAPRLQAAGLALLKTEYCGSADRLESALARYLPIGSQPLVLDYVPGHGLGQMAVMANGEAVLRFQHRRLKEWPPEGGVSAVCESLPLGDHEATWEQSVALLRALDWQGPAMVEYRFDPVRRRAVLMEINGRFWGSQPLAFHAGAEFGWATYQALALGRRPPPVTPRAGLRARYVIPELRRLIRVVFRPGKIPDPAFRRRPWRDLADFLTGYLDPRSRYYVFTRRDPKPFFADLWFVFRKALGLS